MTRLEPAAVQVLPLRIITEIEGALGRGRQQEGEGLTAWGRAREQEGLGDAEGPGPRRFTTRAPACGF